MNIVLDILIPKSKFFLYKRSRKTKDLFCRQGFWTREDFRHFLNALFSNKQRPYLILSDKIDEYFHDTDFNQDNKIDYDEFIQAWKTTIKCVNIFF
jgi:Ca2+-binding EF-hand superfamily protein